MAKPVSATDEQRHALARRITSWLEEQGPRTRLADLHKAMALAGFALTPATISNAAKGERLGAPTIAVFEKFFGERAESWAAPRESRVVEMEERYPAVAEAFAYARAAGIHDEILGLVRRQIGALKSETGPTVEMVQKLIVDAVRGQERFTALLRRPVTGLDDDDDAPAVAHRNGKRKR